MMMRRFGFMKSKLCLSAVLAAAYMMPLEASADVPAFVTHQGRLFDSNGEAVSGTQDLTFKIYDADVDGNEISTSDLIGEPMVVNLWYSTCAPCAKELPEFAEVDAETDDVRFFGINNVDSVEDMEAFASERGVEYDLLRDDSAVFTDAIGAVAFPITLFVASDGTIVDQTGALDADGLRERIAELLASEGTP